MGMLPQALEIIHEMKRKRSNEKNNKKNTLSTLENAFYFIFLLFGPLLFLNLVTFLFLIHFK